MSLLHCLSAKRNTFSSFSFPFKAKSSIQIILLVALKFSAFVFHSRIQNHITEILFQTWKQTQKKNQKYQSFWGLVFFNMNSRLSFSYSQFPLITLSSCRLIFSSTTTVARIFQVFPMKWSFRDNEHTDSWLTNHVKQWEIKQLKASALFFSSLRFQTSPSPFNNVFLFYIHFSIDDKVYV